ncbi:uncharacterized protein LOC110914313 [Helianthus annuus]|uniref:uncharacterized protein LOC110914313 n=1 Tax=Helianthus annuus TaxID=4232 RepID=UPI000B8F274B|nr:uncharacterized protein LOC110914313 [Helianthus annuus]
MKGRRFTWHSENGRKASKIDRFLVNSEFFNAWPEACFKALPCRWSDHCPIILSTKPINFGARPFRVFNSWLDKEGFKEVVVNACAEFVNDGWTPDVYLVHKLRFIRDKIRVWRDLMLKRERERVGSANEEIDELEEALESRDLSEEEEWILAENRRILNEVEFAKSMDLKQRSRVRWAKDGDENSKFFHSQVNSRKASNTIHGLYVGGSWVSKPSLVKKEVFNFFKARLTEEVEDRPSLVCPNLKRISDEDVTWLEARFSLEEIKSAVFDCGSDRAPGPDGFNFRLKKVLGSVISDPQSAFLKGRNILDGVLIINEVCSWLKKCKKKAFLFKIDFEKAYDNIHWKFVVDVCRQMGFGSKWCNWIMGILSSARASALVNGAPTFEFKCSKGMRQGDPISPFLFVIDMEALSCMISKAEEVGLFSGIKLPFDGPCLSHLLFADDALIVGEWSQGNAVNIVRILRCFYACSGLRINLGKSNLVGIGVGEAELKALADVVSCSSDSLPFKYLGLKVGANMNRIANWRPVYDIFEARLALWKSSLLSLGGRVTLIRSVLESLPSYYFSIYKAPVKVISDLEKIIKKFLWGGSGEANKIHWVAWDRVASPKNVGGLGICKLSLINRSLLSKWGWRYKTENKSLWVRTVDAIHSSGSGWIFIPVKKAVSGVWHNIADVFSKTLPGNRSFPSLFRGVVGCGDRILFWLDPWLSDVPLCVLYPNLFSLEVVKDCKVKDRIDGVWLWKHDPEPGVEFSELISLQSAMSSVSLNGSADRWKWLGSHSGLFSVGAAKAALSGPIVADNVFVVDWCKWVPRKCNLFVWRAEMNRIPSMDNLARRGVPVVDGLCPLCRDEAESVEHLFTSCFFSVILWQKISQWCKIPPIFAFSFRDLLEIHKASYIDASKRLVIQGIIIVSCWCLWQARNKVVFSNCEAKVEKA